MLLILLVIRIKYVHLASGLFWILNVFFVPMELKGLHFLIIEFLGSKIHSIVVTRYDYEVFKGFKLIDTYTYICICLRFNMYVYACSIQNGMLKYVRIKVGMYMYMYIGQINEHECVLHIYAHAHTYVP